MLNYQSVSAVTFFLIVILIYRPLPVGWMCLLVKYLQILLFFLNQSNGFNLKFFHTFISESSVKCALPNLLQEFISFIHTRHYFFHITPSFSDLCSHNIFLFPFLYTCVIINQFLFPLFQIGWNKKRNGSFKMQTLNHNLAQTKLY